ncbi:MAG: aminoglycoside phosphotransferase family protein, partial [Dehalococcoidia bacterium]
MNLQDWTPLAEGRVSNVFVSKDKLVLKLAHKTYPGWKVDDEFRRCQAVLKAGVPSPKALEVVEVEERRGIIFEWAGEHDLMNAKLSNPLNLDSGSRFMSKVHQEFLTREAPELPDIKAEAMRMAQELPEGTINQDQFEILQRYLDRLPSGNNICHMDFHPGNIMMTAGYDEGHQIIDWAEAVRGVPAADIAMTSLMLAMAENSPGLSVLLQIIIPIFRKAFEKRYRSYVMSDMKLTQKDLNEWLLLTLIFRMYMWKLESERETLIGMIQAQL